MRPFVLVDADVLSGYFRRNKSLADRPEVKHLDLLLAMDAVRVTGHVYQEVLNGITEGQAGTSRKIQNKLKNIVLVPDRHDYENAVELSRKCTWGGKTVSIADLMNGAVSIARKWKILAIDGDYDEIEEVDRRLERLEIA